MQYQRTRKEQRRKITSGKRRFRCANALGLGNYY